MKQLMRLLTVAGFAFFANAAQAQPATANFNVTANVVGTCIVSAGDLIFGDYLPSAAKTSTSSVAVTCTNGTTYTVGITGGATARAMGGPGGSLGYGMYTDNTYTAAFQVASSGTGVAQNHTIHGRIPAGQYLAAGGYSEQVQVVVVY